MRPTVTSLDQLPAELSDRAEGAIQSGRNVRAGYARGVGLEFGPLIALCQADPIFQRAIGAMHGRSVVLHHKLMNIMLIMRFASLNPAGHIIEFGSYRGGSALFMAAIARLCGLPQKIFALDTYAGMPATDAVLDHHSAGDFQDTDYDSLIKLRDELGLDNLIPLRGLFADTVGNIPPADRRFALAHIDCDIYPSLAFSLEWVKPHMAQGGFIICDDPLTSTCLGAMQAVEEHLVQKGALAEQVFPHLVYRWPPIAGHA
jgi:predicted O-methyltransferase YrrM